MPIKFKNLPGDTAPVTDKSLEHLQEVVREKLKLSKNTVIRIGVTETTLIEDGVKAVLPFGIAHIKKGSDTLYNSLVALQGLAGAVQKVSGPTIVEQPAFDADGSPVPSYDDMTDEQWVIHMAGQLFPGTIHLYQATELYQPVLGTSGGSIYKTCFIGPDLRIAGRIKNNQVSFRATTKHDKCPTGQVKAALARLGIDAEYENRMTGHAPMGGPYDDEHAHEYRALFGAMYAALKPWITSNFPAIGKLTEGVK